MTQPFKLAALAGVLAAALAAPAWSQTSTTAAPKATMPSANSVMSGTTAASSDPYDPSNTQLRAQCLDQATGTWKTTAQCQVFTRNAIPPDVLGGGTPAHAPSTSTSTSASTSTRSSTGATSSLNPPMSSPGTAGTGTSGGAGH